VIRPPRQLNRAAAGPEPRGRDVLDRGRIRLRDRFQVVHASPLSGAGAMRARSEASAAASTMRAAKVSMSPRGKTRSSGVTMPDRSDRRVELSVEAHREAVEGVRARVGEVHDPLGPEAADTR
jgi:hypothetical protein